MNVNVSKKMSLVGTVALAIIGLISTEKIDDVASALIAVVALVGLWTIMQGLVDFAKAWREK